MIANPHNQRRSRGIGPAKPAGWLTGIASIACLTTLLAISSVAGSEPATNEPARVKVSGFGFMGNREMLRLLRNFQTDSEFPIVITRNFMEDAALVLFSRANSEGHLKATLQTKFMLPDGSWRQYVWTNALEVQLPRALATREVRFRMRKGLRFHYRSIKIEGLTALTERDARSYFVSGDTLLQLRANRAYNPELLESSMAALTEALVRRGYRSASVRTNQLDLNEASGAVTVSLQVEEGIPSIVRSVLVTVDAPEDSAGTNQWMFHPAEPYSQLWQQDLARQLREPQYLRGFPDARVEFSQLLSETNGSNIQVDLAARVTTGPRVRLGEVIYTGNERTRAPILESRVNLDPGTWLDRIEAEHSRQRLARLGVFESVRLRYEDVDAETRNVRYEFKEGKPFSLSVLAGYGSYELLRGGLEFEHRNALGRAHDLRVRALQSFKSSNGDLQYTVPELFGENLDVFFKGSGLRREEITFTREEYGGSVGMRKHLEAIQTDLSVHYDYEFLNASDLNAATNALGVAQARSAALVLDLNRDRRVSPLLPREGLKLFGKFEAASAALGGNVDYQRIILGGSYHLDLRGGRLLHLGLTHGVALTLGGSPADLPFNKRFFPGGENSVRGYQEGGGSPLDADGNQLGAETYTQANIELEQLLTESWSVVAFFDAVGVARDRSNYPWDEELYSVGGGIRWRSIIGPVRLEYGHNLSPRTLDPAGTLHFSIGFPF